MTPVSSPLPQIPLLPSPLSHSTACSSIRSTGRHRDGGEELGGLEEEEGEPVVGEAIREAALGGGAGGGGVVGEATREAARGSGVWGRRRRRLEGERGAGGGRPGADLAGKPPPSLPEARSGKPRPDLGHPTATPTATLDGDGPQWRRPSTRRRRPRCGGKGIWQLTSSATSRAHRRQPPRAPVAVGHPARPSPSATSRGARRSPPCLVRPRERGGDRKRRRRWVEETRKCEKEERKRLLG
ncbi:hypothetical protein DAI22_11g245600 [Oryza sativa Japonica Group]|nr:hypothetical protein DAI22_11g245600 [Oryza sativa Japonica Group]